MHKRLFIVLLLGFSSGLPLSLISSTLQAWFAEKGMSIALTGSLSLISLPYIYRFLWAPLLDRISLFSLGKRRSWILVMQIALLFGFNLMAWLSPNNTPYLLTFLAFIIATLSATQDIAIDAHRTEYLPTNEYALGVSVAVFGYRIALFITGAVSLIIAEYFDWQTSYRIMGSLMLIGVIGTILSPEPSTPQKNIKFSDSFIKPCKEIFARHKIISILCFIFFFKAGEAFTTTTSGIVMPFLIQGLHFSLSSIAYINKIMGISSILLGGLAAGILMLRWSLYKALLVFGIIQAIANIFFVVLAMVGKNIFLFALTVVCDNFAAGMGATAIVAFFMRLVNPQFTAAQLSIFIALATVPRVISGPVAAILQSYFGWTGLYEISFLISLLFIPFLFNLSKENFFTIPSKESLEISSNVKESVFE